MTFPVPANTEREGKEAGSQEGSAEQLHVGSMEQSHCHLGGDRFTWRNITGFPESTGLGLPCRVLGKEAGEEQRGELGMCWSFNRGTAQLAKQYATYELFELLMGNAGIASGDFTQGQGDPAGRQMAIPALAPSLVSWERSVPSLCLHVNTPKHHFLSHGYAAGM